MARVPRLPRSTSGGTAARAGGAIVQGLRWLLGAVTTRSPAALLAAGAIIVLRPVLPAVRPFRAAAGACSSRDARPGGRDARLGPDSTAVQDRGGYVGDGLYRVVGGLLGDVGAHIVVVFCFLAGISC